MKTTLLNKRFLFYLFCTGLMSCSQLEQKKETTTPASFDRGDNVHVESGDIKNISTADNANFRDDATVPLNVNVFLDGISNRSKSKNLSDLSPQMPLHSSQSVLTDVNPEISNEQRSHQQSK